MKNLAAMIAASSLMLASSAAIAAPVERASAPIQDESALMDSGFIGFALVFGAGAAVGALIYSLIKGGDDETPVSP